jgi:hypothetical protein
VLPIFGLTPDDMRQTNQLVERLLDTLLRGFVRPVTARVDFGHVIQMLREGDVKNGSVLTANSPPYLQIRRGICRHSQNSNLRLFELNNRKVNILIPEHAGRVASSRRVLHAPNAARVDFSDFTITRNNAQSA